jgi:Mis12 protein
LQWSEIFETKLDANFMRFEEYVFDKGVLTVPPHFILPNYAHLMVMTMMGLYFYINQNISLDEDELDAEIGRVSERLKATAFLNDHLDRELELLAHENHQLNLLESRFHQLFSILASHNGIHNGISS